MSEAKLDAAAGSAEPGSGWELLAISLHMELRKTQRKLRKACELLGEAMDEHADPDDPDYNQCEQTRCLWCEQANEVVEWAKQNDPSAGTGEAR